ncbi:MAG: DUF2203 domain-containing protein [Gemmataceae bacterium]
MAPSRGRYQADRRTQRRRHSTSITLAQARRMLPLVSRVVADIRDHWRQLTALELEQARLDARRRHLAWPDRRRRYQIAEEIQYHVRELRSALAELDTLEVVLVDPEKGEAAFPTTIHGQPGFFLWTLGQDAPHWWCYADETRRRIVPEHWLQDVSAQDAAGS